VDEQDVRDQAQAFCDALASGDVDRAIEDFSPELRRTIGEVLALLPLPASEITIDSIERGGAGFGVVLRLVGESDEVQIQTRWKDRDGRPTLVEASHLSRTELAGPAGEGDGGDEEGETAP
jgi:hypothetical protein